MCSFSQSINTEYHLLLTRSMLDSAVDKSLDLGSGGDIKFKLHPLGVGFFGGEGQSLQPPSEKSRLESAQSLW